MHFSNTSKHRTLQMTLVGLMTSVICILAPFSFPLPFSPVPVSLGTLAIYLASMVLGMKRGFISVSLYLLLGFVGMPVFTGFTGGIGKLFGPTGGYMIGYLFIALTCGYFADKYNNIPCSILGMILGTCSCYTFGTIWLTIQTELDFVTALSVGVLPFLPGDIAKMGIAVTIGYQLKMRLKKDAMI